MISMLVSIPMPRSLSATYSACHRANAEPREPIFSIATSLQMLSQPEHAPDKTHRFASIFARALSRFTPHLRDGSVGDFVDNAARHRVQRFFLGRRHLP